MVRAGSAYGKKPKKKVEKVVKKNGHCIECAKAYLMQSAPQNPIVAECEVNHQRQVAEANMCGIGCFEELSGETVIHNMIKAKLY